MSISRATVAAIAGSVAFAITTLVLLDFNNELLTRVFWDPSGIRIYFPLGAAFVAAIVFAQTRYEDFSPLLKACLRASALGLAVLLIVEIPDYSLANPENQRALDYVNYGYFVGLACALASVFRPSFVAPTVIYLASTRHLVMSISGLPMSTLDIRYMLDMALYLAVFGIFVVKLGPRIHPWLASPMRQAEIVGVGFGLHLANYFWSGVAKVVIGPTPWYWTFENATYNQIPYTIESGILPLGHIPWLAQVAYDLFKITHIPLNGIIVLVQLLAIVCVLKVNWLKITSVLFDLLHAGIYIFGGLFFWPWIWNNLTIWWAARSSKKEGLPVPTKVACIAAVLLGFPAFHINEAAWLAWYDVADARQVRFEAVLADGRTVPVPSAFFVSHSYSVSHGSMGDRSIDGQYEGTQLASTDSFERNESQGKCVDPKTLKRERPAETEAQRTERMATLGRFLKFHHQKMLQREATFGPGSWYFHAHHHPSNPFLYDEFNKLSLKDVIGYNLVMESGCYGMQDGYVTRKILQTDTEFYDVR